MDRGLSYIAKRLTFIILRLAPIIMRLQLPIIINIEAALTLLSEGLPTPNFLGYTLFLMVMAVIQTVLFIPKTIYWRIEMI